MATILDITQKIKKIVLGDSCMIMTTQGGSRTFTLDDQGDSRGNCAVDLQFKRAVSTQVASGNATVLSGGVNNTAGGQYSFIGGGCGNLTCAGTAGSGGVVVGGCGNVSVCNAFVGSGSGNSTCGNWSVISGGCNNTITARAAIILGGICNQAGNALVVAGGAGANTTGGVWNSGNCFTSNPTVCIPGCLSVVVGGFQNKATGTLASAISGCNNTASGCLSVVVGGFQNQATGHFSSAISGHSNTTSSSYSFIGGGFGNSVSTSYSSISGGRSNSVSGSSGTVAGGRSNSASGMYTTVGGGCLNSATGESSTISGGCSNFTFGGVSFIGGGRSNCACGNWGIINGGVFNLLTTGSCHGIIVGGICNTGSSIYGTILGGSRNRANLYGQISWGTNKFSTTLGNNQSISLNVSKVTTDATATDLTLDAATPGASNRISITSGKTLSCFINVSGINSTGSDGVQFLRQVVIANVGGTTGLVGSVQTVGTDIASGGASTWSISITADNTNDALTITVTGAASTTIRWSARIEAIELEYGT